MQTEIAILQNIIIKRLPSQLLRPALLFILLSVTTLVFATEKEESNSNFLIKNLATRLVDNVFMVDVEQEINLNKTVIEALVNGVPITLETQFSVYTESWYMSTTILNLSQKYKINYHALSQQYILTNLNTEKQLSFSSLHRVLATLSKITDIPLVDKNLLPKNEELYIKVRNQLDIGSLPLPLRATAYFSSSWRLKSDWATWILKE